MFIFHLQSSISSQRLEAHLGTCTLNYAICMHSVSTVGVCTHMWHEHSCQLSKDALDSPGDLTDFESLSRDPGITLFCPGISYFSG